MPFNEADTPSMEAYGDKEEKNRIEKGTLYLVSTPIGNMADLSPRAVKVLTACDFVAAEDTRVTARLLAMLGISRPLLSYREHNRRSGGEQILERLQRGETCALVTDAGTPAVSDPGADIAALCAEKGIPVTAVPGACALIDALVLSGLDTRRFSFEGFVEGTDTQRRERLEEIRPYRGTLIFYTAPHDLRRRLQEFREVLGNRRMALCRELTKRNEEVLRTDLEGAIAHYAEQEPRGEYVLVIEGCRPDSSDCFWKELTTAQHVAFYQEGGMSRMEAIKAAARDRGLPKNEVYKALL